MCSQAPNILLSVTVRQSGSWDRHPTSPARICLASAEPRGHLPRKKPHVPTGTEQTLPRHHHPSRQPGLSRSTSDAEPAGDRQCGCVSWSEKQQTTGTVSKPGFPTLDPFDTPGAVSRQRQYWQAGRSPAAPRIPHCRCKRRRPRTHTGSDLAHLLGDSCTCRWTSSW